MTGAKFKVMLGGLGIPPSWFAAHMGVTMRTVVRWFDVAQVPQRVQDAMDELCQLTDAQIAKMFNQSPLRTYRTDDAMTSVAVGDQLLPASWHRALTFRALELVRGAGRDVDVVYA